ncbi:C40 family peptidase [Streptomyces luteolus]|uniref:NlpC/P60 family protein n=1 Tax=Streptomyces luteolus TaxID=3043615 RepID=A0ABT6T4I6_9ACTN|nr:C40 family peptidase [Streptomyces sp. B-S-A12]MDI3422778.1 NlpC/P60 family protein [Streptomyces sp. B-S-A12]
MASHRRPSQLGLGRDRSTRAALLSAAAATAAAALTAPSATADPQATPAATKAQVDRLFEEAERATQAYDKADERADRLRREIAHAKDSVARGQERINTMRGALGSLAGAQYRSGGIDPTLALMLSEDPEGYLAKSSTLNRINARQSAELDKLRTAQRELAQEREEATGKLADLEASRKAVARHKRQVEAKLAKAQRLLNSLSPADRAAFAEGSGAAGIPALTGTPSSDRAAAAVAAIRQAIGRPYVWGANGPSGFDCSGLTQWAYGQAGVGLPRTSQAQRGSGRQVSLAEARPGDLVTYRDDASHIGMYMGGGQVVHAPYPGAAVRYDPVGMMPVSGVTRV